MSRVLQSSSSVALDGKQVIARSLVESHGKYPNLVLQQNFAATGGVALEPLQLSQETAYVADAILFRANDPSTVQSLVAQGKLRSVRKLGNNSYRGQLPRPALNPVHEAAGLVAIPGVTQLEPDFLLVTADVAIEPSLADRDADGHLDPELEGSMAPASTPVATLSPEAILADVEHRLAEVPLGARVLTFDLPLSDARPEVAYRPYFMEQNFLLIAAPSQYASIYPQSSYNSGYPSNGTVYVRSLSGDQGMQIRHKDSLPFSLLQIDLSEYSTVYMADSVNLIGYRKDGTTVTHSCVLDRQIDGTGPLNDFQTFTLPSNFTNLDRVVFVNNGFMMDNLVVSPSGEETPLPAPPAPPTRFDITWDGFPHKVGEVTAVTGPYAPSTINFGAPAVKSQIGAMIGPALELRGTGASYEQFSCVLGRGTTNYVGEFDLTIPDGGSLALFLDFKGTFRRLDFGSTGTLSLYTPSATGATGTTTSLTPFVPKNVSKIRVEVDMVAGTFKIFTNGTLVHSGSGIPLASAGNELIDMRWSASVGSTQSIGIDNIRIIGAIPENPGFTGPRARITPLTFSFPSTTIGTTVNRYILVENIGTQPLTIRNLRTDSPHFQTNTAQLDLAPTESGVLPIAFAPIAVGAQTGHLLFDTNESTSAAKSITLLGTATAAPAVHVTPATLHVTMLPNDVGTEEFMIHNSGDGTLQWSFITPSATTSPAPLSPDDARFGSLWSMRSPAAGIGGIDAVHAWAIRSEAPAIPVAVIDTGIDYTHEDLAENVPANPGEIPGNGVDDDGNGFIDDVRGWNFYADTANAMDDHGHGTHVSGIIAARGNNALGVTGVTWKSSLLPIKFLNAQGFGYTSDAIASVEYARERGCRVINASWGGGGYSTLLRDSIGNFTTANDGLFVCAAGNAIRDNDSQPYFPASYGVSGIISVAASDSADKLAYFSNWGANSVHLAAPGDAILSCVPGNKYALCSGTSMAAPHVTGSVALLFQHHSKLTAAECLLRVSANADHPPGLADKAQGGARLNVYSALSSTVAPWIQPAVWSGTVPAGANVKVPLNLNTAGLAPGYYTAALALQTNDPASSQVAISVELKIRPRNNLGEWLNDHFAVNNLLFESAASNTWNNQADPDQDGVPNLLEFVTGSDPGRSSLHPLELTGDDAGQRAVRFKVRNDLSGAAYRIEWTEDLCDGTWRSDNLELRSVEPADNGSATIMEAKLKVLDSSQGKAFFRIVGSEK